MLEVAEVHMAVKRQPGVGRNTATLTWRHVLFGGGVFDVSGEHPNKKGWEIFKGLMTTVVGAAVVAMVIYLVVGAVAGTTYLFNENQTPTVLITVAAAWAAQALAVVAATLAAALQPE